MERWNRVIMKLSGEALAGDKKFGFSTDIIRDVALQIKQCLSKELQIGIVIGGGNFWRGRKGNEIDRVRSDQIGMLATVMNCIYVSEIFRGEGIDTMVTSPFSIGNITEQFSKAKALSFMNSGGIVFFSGGTGHPYFSTDTGVALYASILEADIILLAKAIDGVYSADPKESPDAVKYDTISLNEVLTQKLKVIDLSATAICLENHIPLAVFGLNKKDSIKNALQGKITGTIVTA